MNWKFISSENLGARPIHSIEDGRLIGYEGWRTLRSIFTADWKPVLSSSTDFVKQGDGIWYDSRVSSTCQYHFDCDPSNNECVHKNCVSTICNRDIPRGADAEWLERFGTCEALWNLDYPENTCHASNIVNSNCKCGLHSYASLDKLKESPQWHIMSKRNSILGPHRSLTYPVRIAHAGSILKGSQGIKSHIATITGISIPPEYPFPEYPFPDEDSEIKEVSQFYNIPILGSTSNDPTSEQVLHQNYGE